MSCGDYCGDCKGRGMAFYPRGGLSKLDTCQRCGGTGTIGKGEPKLPPFAVRIMSWAIFAFLLLCVIAAVATLTHETVKMLLETFK